MLFLAYELGYWFNHWLSHKVPLLWEFHKVHHTARSAHAADEFPRASGLHLDLRQHPGVLGRGRQRLRQLHVRRDRLSICALRHQHHLVLFIHAYVHLQHSHMWIAFRGLAGRIFVSPAHHQVHHSDNPKHFNKNFGSCLALWDWMFGTLYVPAEGARAAHLRLRRSSRRAHGQGRVGRSADQCGRPSQAAVAAPPRRTGAGRRTQADIIFEKFTHSPMELLVPDYLYRHDSIIASHKFIRI